MPKKLLVVIAFLVFFFSLNAQKTSKYPSLLWEITGNGLQKPSYLYGTMHVSKKVAYHLSDSFFEALEKVDVVGLETNPGEWLVNMKKYGIFNQLKNQLDFGQVSSDFYTNAYKFSFPANQQLATLLSNDADIINGLLYRYSNRSQDFEEATYIDLFIYQAGSKWGKKVISLEDFKTSEILAQKSSLPDPDAENDYSYTNKKYKNYYALYGQVDDAYRRGDLDALDSLTRLMNTNANHQKYLIDERNILMARTMDSVMKKQALFAGIGAAHLPGANGVIEMLRKKGYTVTAVISKGDKKGKKTQEKLEETYKPLIPKSTQVVDSLFTCELPGPFTSIIEEEAASYSLYTDMANGSYYTLTRMRTYGALFGVSADMMLQKLDSLFYENIPGKIIQKKQVTTNTGIKGYDILNLTRRGDYQRYQIYATDMELIMIKLGGHGNYVKDGEGNRFFNSIKFIPAGKGSIDKVYTPATGGFEVKIPDNLFYYKSYTGRNVGRAENLFAYNKNKDISVGVVHAYYNDFNDLEEDTFELNSLADKFMKSMEFKKEITRSLEREQGFPCIKFSAARKETVLQAKILIKGVHYYLVYSVGQRSTLAASQEYISSFKLKEFKYINEQKVITDKEYFFKVKDEMTISDNNEINEALADDYKKIELAKKKGKYNTDYEYSFKDKTYFSPSSGEHVKIEYQKYNDYDYRDKNEIWKNICNYYKKNTTLQVSSYHIFPADSMKRFEIFLKDTATQRGLKSIYYINNGLIYTLTAQYDTTIGISGWEDGFLDSFRPLDTVIGKDVFANKFPLLLKDLSSADTNKKYAANQTLTYFKLEKIYQDDFIKYLKDTATLFKLDETAQANLFVNGGNLKSDAIIPVYKNLYNALSENSYLQICLLKGLAYLGTTAGHNAIMEMMKKETPIVGDEQTVESFFEPLYDSLELTKNLFPGLMEITRFEEYKMPVFRLMAKLVQKDLLKPIVYAPQKTSLLKEANYELKRFNASYVSGINSNRGNGSLESMAKAEADRIAQSISGSASGDNYDEGGEQVGAMLTNFCRILGPLGSVDPQVKAFFDKAIKIKDENTLLNISLIMFKNKFAVNDTIWTFFSANVKTRVLLYEELEELKATEKFDKKYLSQESFCKAKILEQLSYTDYRNDSGTDKKPEKEPEDSIVLLKKVEAHNKYDKGNIYYFIRKAVKDKEQRKTIAWVYVPDSKTGISARMETLETGYQVEDREREEVMHEALSKFYHRYHPRWYNGYNYD